MKEISFAWTSPALVAGIKTVTRRDWQADYARQFGRGDQVRALNRQRRFGGEILGIIELVEDAMLDTREMFEEDVQAEGIPWLRERGLLSAKLLEKWDEMCRWDESCRALWVVRFRVVSLEPNAEQLARAKGAGRPKKENPQMSLFVEAQGGAR